METSLIVIIVIGVLLIVVVAKVKMNKDLKIKLGKTSLQAALDSLEHFDVSIHHINPLSGFIAASHDYRKLAVCYLESIPLVYPYTSLIKCEIIQDGETSYSKSTASTIGRAAVGALFAGGAGLLLGGMSAAQKKKIKIKKLHLKLFFRDLDNPSFTLTFFESYDQSKGTSPIDNVDGKDLVKALEEINKWKDVLEVIIDSNLSAVGDE